MCVAFGSGKLVNCSPVLIPGEFASLVGVSISEEFGILSDGNLLSVGPEAGLSLLDGGGGG